MNYITFDEDYQYHLKSDICSLPNSDKKRLSDRSFRAALHKLHHLKIDLIRDDLFSLYSFTGRPARDPAVLIRSFFLMLHFKYLSIDSWCEAVANDNLLLFLIGSTSIPTVATHYDFINRLTHDDPSLSDLLPEGYNRSRSDKKLKRNEKWINFDDEDTKSLVDAYNCDLGWDANRFSFSLQKIFHKLAVIPSMDLGLIDSKDMVLSGDGSCLHISSSPHGHKVKDVDNSINYRYSAPEADIGWDSDLCAYYYGFTMYNITNHNRDLKIDLPVFLSLEKASRHDALNSISATAQLLYLNSFLGVQCPKYMCFDSASDSRLMHGFLEHHGITGIIDVNFKGRNPYGDYDDLNDQGVPVCKVGQPMIDCGYDSDRHRRKYRCPLAMGKIKECPFKSECCPNSDYGKTRYVKQKDDPRLFGPIQFQSPKWKSIYKNRTSTERMNTRILNDYNLHKMMVRNRAKNLFFIIFAGINIHMDAWVKVFDN